MAESCLWLVNHNGTVFTLPTQSRLFSQLPGTYNDTLAIKRLAVSRWGTWAVGHDHRPYVYVRGSDVPIRIPETTYENQRWSPLHGFSKKSLMRSDRPAWSDESGKQERPKESIRLPSAYWDWDGDWLVDDNLRGEVVVLGGWQYAVDFPSKYTPEPHWNSFVRRRKWTHFRRFSCTDAWARISDMETVENSECFIDISVGGFLIPSQPNGFLSVWAVMNSGSVYVRTDVHRDNPEGSNWQLIDLEGHHGIINISVGASNLVWAVTWDGRALVRTHVSRDNVYGKGWVEVECPDESTRLMQIAVGCNAVWGLSRDGKVWFRKGTWGDNTFWHENSAVGKLWVEMVGDMSHISLSARDQVFALDNSDRYVYFRTGVTRHDLTGKTWQKVALKEDLSVFLELGLMADGRVCSCGLDEETPCEIHGSGRKRNLSASTSCSSLSVTTSASSSAPKDNDGFSECVPMTQLQPSRPRQMSLLFQEDNLPPAWSVQDGESGVWMKPSDDQPSPSVSDSHDPDTPQPSEDKGQITLSSKLNTEPQIKDMEPSSGSLLKHPASHRVRSISEMSCGGSQLTSSTTLSPASSTSTLHQRPSVESYPTGVDEADSGSGGNTPECYEGTLSLGLVAGLRNMDSTHTQAGEVESLEVNSERSNDIDTLLQPNSLASCVLSDATGSVQSPERLAEQKKVANFHNNFDDRQMSCRDEENTRGEKEALEGRNSQQDSPSDFTSTSDLPEVDQDLKQVGHNTSTISKKTQVEGEVCATSVRNNDLSQVKYSEAIGTNTRETITHLQSSNVCNNDALSTETCAPLPVPIACESNSDLKPQQASEVPVSPKGNANTSSDQLSIRASSPNETHLVKRRHSTSKSHKRKSGGRRSDPAGTAEEDPIVFKPPRKKKEKAKDGRAGSATSTDESVVGLDSAASPVNCEPVIGSKSLSPDSHDKPSEHSHEQVYSSTTEISEVEISIENKRTIPPQPSHADKTRSSAALDSQSTDKCGVTDLECLSKSCETAIVNGHSEHSKAQIHETKTKNENPNTDNSSADHKSNLQNEKSEISITIVDVIEEIEKKGIPVDTKQYLKQFHPVSHKETQDQDFVEDSAKDIISTVDGIDSEKAEDKHKDVTPPAAQNDSEKAENDDANERGELGTCTTAVSYTPVSRVETKHQEADANPTVVNSSETSQPVVKDKLMKSEKPEAGLTRKSAVKKKPKTKTLKLSIRENAPKWAPLTRLRPSSKKAEGQGSGSESDDIADFVTDLLSDDEHLDETDTLEGDLGGVVHRNSVDQGEVHREIISTLLNQSEIQPAATQVLNQTSSSTDIDPGSSITSPMSDRLHSITDSLTSPTSDRLHSITDSIASSHRNSPTVISDTALQRLALYRQTPSPARVSGSTASDLDQYPECLPGQAILQAQPRLSWRWLDATSCLFDDPTKVDWLSNADSDTEPSSRSSVKIEKYLRENLLKQLQTRNQRETAKFSSVEAAVERSTWVRKSTMQVYHRGRYSRWITCQVELEQGIGEREQGSLFVHYSRKRRHESIHVLLRDITCVKMASDTDVPSLFVVYTAESNLSHTPLMLQASSEAEAAEWLDHLSYARATAWNLNCPVQPGAVWACSFTGDVLVSPVSQVTVKPYERCWGQHGGHMALVETSPSGVTWAIGFDKQAYVYNGGYGGAVCTGQSDMSSGIQPVKDMHRVFVYENQKWFPVLGWCNKGVFRRDFHWVTSSGQFVQSKDEVKLPSSKWTWTSDWTIDFSLTRGVDDRGWQYSVHFDGPFHRSCHIRDQYRRRRWLRRCSISLQAPWTNSGLLHISDLSIQIDPVQSPSNPIVMWAVAANGDVLCRYGVTAENPMGMSWGHVPTDLDKPFTSISVGGSGQVWGVAGDGSVWYRTGVSQENPAGKFWSQVVPPPPGSSHIRQVSVGALAVWAVDTGDNLWHRENVTPSYPEGTGWASVASKVKRVNVGPQNQVWIVADSGFLKSRHKPGVIYHRVGISESCPEGTDWKLVIGSGWAHVSVRGLIEPTDALS